MSKSEEQLFKAKEEARIKYELTGLRHSHCKKHGVLPINMFFLRKDKEGKHVPDKTCKACVKKRRKSFSKAKRRKYQKNATNKKIQKRKDSPEFHRLERATANAKAKKARENLEESYIIKLLCSHGEMKAKDVQPWMITAKIKELTERRETIEKRKSNPAIKKTRKKASDKKLREKLSDGYIRTLLRLKGFKTEEITQEMIDKQRAQTKERRDMREKNGKYASEAQKLSDNYLRKVVQSKTGLPKDQITQQMMDEAKERILERRARTGKEPKSAELRIKFQYAKRNAKARNKNQNELKEQE